MQTQDLYFNFRGGIISPGYLDELLSLASSARVSHIRFGQRQQMIMEVDENRYPSFAKACIEKQVPFYKAGDVCPTLVSSYVGTKIFTTENWLKESVYKDVFDLFSHLSTLKINVCDGRQSHTPLYSGHLNWVSSNHLHYWWLFLRLPGTPEVYPWPELVYTNDLARLSNVLEHLLITAKSEAEKSPEYLFNKTKSSLAISTRLPSESFAPPVFHLPYYEGFNKDGDKYWLGIYRRDELFPVECLREICTLCMETKIGEIYITSWKSLIIKSIDPQNRKLWDAVLGRFRINVRHAANELNWQVEDHCEDGLVLKRHVIRYFDKEDVRTYGLCFAVQTRPLSSVFGSVIIRRQQRMNTNRRKSMERYDILYTRDFNPNTIDLVLYREGVEKEQLGPYIVSLCKFYYESQLREVALKAEHVLEPVTVSRDKTSHVLFQCRHCYTVYDPANGDESKGIQPGNAFSRLPDDYVCELCAAPETAFIQIEKSQLINQ